MNATGIQDELRHHLELAERWDSEADTDGLFRHCSHLLLTARALEAAASAQPPGGLNPAVLGCFGAVLDSMATVSLLLDRARDGQAGQLTPNDGQADPARLLFAINQNLRFAAEAAELGQQVLAGPRGDNE
jgi:hypothetical protein